MSRFDSVQQELDWAKSCAQQGNQRFVEYLQDGSFGLVIEDDSETGGSIHKVKMFKDPPVEISHLFRNSLLDIKHSFDRSLHAAAHEAGQRGFDRNYPWADSLSGLEGIIRKRNLDRKSRLPEFILKEIFAQKPYSGPPELPASHYLIREIAQMANDKHTIGFEVIPTPHTTTIANAVFVGTSLKIPRWDPVNKECEIARALPGASQDYGNTQLTVDIRFKRAGPIGQVHAFDVLVHFLNRAQACLEGFKRACSG